MMREMALAFNLKINDYASIKLQLEMRNMMLPKEKPHIMEKNKNEIKFWNFMKNNFQEKKETLNRQVAAKSRRKMLENE